MGVARSGSVRHADEHGLFLHRAALLNANGRDDSEDYQRCLPNRPCRFGGTLQQIDKAGSRHQGAFFKERH